MMYLICMYVCMYVCTHANHSFPSLTVDVNPSLISEDVGKIFMLSPNI